MQVMIVHSNFELTSVWCRHLVRLGAGVLVAGNGVEALRLLQEQAFDVIVVDLMMKEGSGLAIADYVNFNMPGTNVVFVTDTTFFSDGSIFVHSANARAFIETRTPPQDLAEIVHHYGCEGGATAAVPPKKERETSKMGEH